MLGRYLNGQTGETCFLTALLKREDGTAGSDWVDAGDIVALYKTQCHNDRPQIQDRLTRYLANTLPTNAFLTCFQREMLSFLFHDSVLFATPSPAVTIGQESPRSMLWGMWPLCCLHHRCCCLWDSKTLEEDGQFVWKGYIILSNRQGPNLDLIGWCLLAVDNLTTSSLQDFSGVETSYPILGQHVMLILHNRQ